MRAKQAEFINKHHFDKEIQDSQHTRGDRVGQYLSKDTNHRGMKTKLSKVTRKSPAQMKEWSILSDHVKYITSDGSKTFNNLSIDELNY